MEMEGSGSEAQLPGFRFHPTEEELLDFYLRRATAGKKLNYDIIATVNLYLYEPWDLPALAKLGEKEWYFFVPRDRRQVNGGRLNRTTERGFWKATGSDRPIRNAADPRRIIGFKKTLVYYRGRAPRSTKTDWVMNEYRLPDASTSSTATHPHPKEDIVLCKVYRKATSLKEMEQRAAMEEHSPVAAAAETGSTSSGSDQENSRKWTYDELVKEIMEEEVEMPAEETEDSSSSASWATTAVASLQEPSIVRPPPAMSQAMPKQPEVAAEARQSPMLPALQVPSHASFDWMQDPFVTQLRSPWLDQWSPLYAQLLNF